MNPILFEFNKLSNAIQFDALLKYPQERYSNRWQTETPLSGGMAIATTQTEQARSYSLGVLLGDVSNNVRFIETEIQSLIGFSQKRILVGVSWEDFRFSPAIITQLQIDRLQYVRGKCVVASFEFTLDQVSSLSLGGQ